MNTKGSGYYGYNPSPMYRAVLVLEDGTRVECPKHFNKKDALADAVKYGDSLLGNLSEMNIEKL